MTELEYNQNKNLGYIPEKINHNFIFNDNRTLFLLGKAYKVLSKLDSLCNQMEFYNIFTNMHIYLEAICSSEIEGTHANIKEVLNTTPTPKENIQKIKNLYNTTHMFFKSNRYFGKKIYNIKTIENINAHLFKKVLSVCEHTGKIRDFQNYWGGDNILSAYFVPPPPDMVKDLIKDLNEFWLNDEYFIPELIKIAIYHYQFETIHPFADGNGRTGRLLISLQLRDCDLLSLPILCLSNYWKQNKGQYYNALTITRESHNIEYWVRYFMQSVICAGEERIETIWKIVQLKAASIEKIKERYKNPTNHLKVLDYLINETPIISVKDIQKHLNISYQGANKIIDNFVELKILKDTSKTKRNRLFLFEEYQNLVFNLTDLAGEV